MNTNNAIIAAAQGRQYGSYELADRIVGLSAVISAIVLQIGQPTDKNFCKETAKEVDKRIMLEMQYLTFNEIKMACDNAIYGEEKVYKLCAMDMVRWIRDYAHSEERQTAFAIYNAGKLKTPPTKAISGPNSDTQTKNIILYYWNEIKEFGRFPSRIIQPKAECFDWLCEKGYIADGKARIDSMLKTMGSRVRQDDGERLDTIVFGKSDELMRAKANCFYNYLKSCPSPPNYD